MSTQDKPSEHGPQPLDSLMNGLNLKNTDLVRHSTQQLTHKQVSKARLGRALTFPIKKKVLTALNAWARSPRIKDAPTEEKAAEEKYTLKDLFNY